MRYHSKTYLANELVAYHYAIIVGHRGGLLKVIADSYYADSIALNEVTLSTLLDRLRINETIEHFKIYNGFLEKENGKLNIYYNNGRSLVKIPSLNDTINSKVENTIDNNIWNYEISKITSEGIFLDYIEAIDDINTIKLPNGVFALHEFGGGVAHLKMCDSLEILGDGCFEELEDIYKITFSPAIKIIPERCFYRSSLQEVSFSGYEEEIKPYAFSQTNISCSIITNARTIGEYAFQSCSDLIDIQIPTGMRNIESFAFYNFLQYGFFYLKSPINFIKNIHVISLNCECWYNTAQDEKSNLIFVKLCVSCQIC